MWYIKQGACFVVSLKRKKYSPLKKISKNKFILHTITYYYAFKNNKKFNFPILNRVLYLRNQVILILYHTKIHSSMVLNAHEI